MKKHIKKHEMAIMIIVIILTVVVLGTFIGLLYVNYHSKLEIARDQEIAKQFLNPQFEIDIEDLNSEESNAETVPDTEQDDTWAIDIEALREINPDAVGWIWMPNSEINYPVVLGEDNNYYLTHNFDRDETKEGAIFVDYRCSLEDNDLVIYGHNTSSGKFDSLLSFIQDDSYWASHPYFIFYSEEYPMGVIYDIFSFFKTDISTTENIAEVYLIASDEDYPGYLEGLKSKSYFDTGIEINPDQQTIILSTCSYMSNKRCVVCGIARSSTEEDKEEKSTTPT